MARGVTRILAAAREPEIVDLGRLLGIMGASIAGLGTSTIEVRGVDSLGGGVHRVIPDRIEAATLLLAAAITGGQAAATGAAPEHLQAVLARLADCGAEIEVAGDRVALAPGVRLRPVDIVAEPYPGVPTDLQAQWTAFLSLASGRSTIEDRVFPSRFFHVAELNRMGARIVVDKATATVAGVERLGGAGSWLPTCGRAPHWCWPDWLPKGQPRCIASPIWTAATKGWTESCGDSARGLSGLRREREMQPHRGESVSGSLSLRERVRVMVGPVNQRGPHPSPLPEGEGNGHGREKCPTIEHVHRHGY